MSDTYEYFDELELRDPELRDQAQFDALSEQIANARANAPALAESLTGIDPHAIRDRAALATLPILRKSELIERQKKNFPERDPFGGLTAVKSSQLANVFASPGPIYNPAAARPDYWRLARALFAAGFRRGHSIHNSFPYHLAPTGSMFESGAHALGCAVTPAGPDSVELQARIVSEVKPRGYMGTPSFLKALIDTGIATGADYRSMRRALVSGEALSPSLRNDIKMMGVKIKQCYASSDLGLIAYEAIGGEGLIVDEWSIVEIVHPASGETLPDGEVGEVVVTSLNPDYPLIRFATGDLSAVMSGMCACGRTNVRLKGLLGRVDQATKVRGIFVHPSQVAAVAKRHKEIGRFRLLVDRIEANDLMTLKCETAAGVDHALVAKIAATLKAVTQIDGEVELFKTGTLANDGKVIEDIREID